MPWDGWYHITGSTYGTWLPGDPRGHRTRHHREHVENDYKNPYVTERSAERHEHAKSLMMRDAVHLSSEARQVALVAMRKSLESKGCCVGAIAVGATHYHILAQTPDPRKHVGIAKKRAARRLSELGLIEQGGVWAIRSRSSGIRDESHFRNTIRYIQAHRDDGAAVWIQE